MADLRAAMAEAGATGVATYVQSGNVVFDHPLDDAATLGALVRDVITSGHGLDVPVVVRRGVEMHEIAVRHPDEGSIDAKFLHVVFFDVEPAPGAVLDRDRFAPDRFVVDGREAYLTYPQGSARSKLTIDVFERAFGVTATARNMHTVGRLAHLVGGSPPGA